MNPLRTLSRVARSVLHLNRPREVAALTRLMEPEPAHRLLDVGCGDGYLTSRFAKSVREVVGIDPDPKMIAMARCLNPGQSFHFDEGVAEELPYASGSFDRVVAVSVVEHFQDPAAGLKEMGRVLRPGGVLAISVDSLLPENSSEVFRRWHSERYHVTTYFKADQLLEMLRNGGLIPDVETMEGIHTSRCAGAFRRAYMRGKVFWFPLFPLFLGICRLSDCIGLGGLMPPQILIVRATKPRGGSG
jgi:SAM-dependent methyltransferase